jgi:transcriptional regulator with XRE-family HTH domain
MNVSKKICESIEILCSFNHISISELEDRIGFSKGYISRCKNGKKKLSVDCCYDIASIFNTTINDLLSDKYKNEFKEKKIEELKKQIAEIEKST